MHVAAIVILVTGALVATVFRAGPRQQSAKEKVNETPRIQEMIAFRATPEKPPSKATPPAVEKAAAAAPAPGPPRDERPPRTAVTAGVPGEAPHRIIFFDVPPPLGGEKATGPAGTEPKASVAFKPSTLPGAEAGNIGDETLLMRPQIVQCVLDTAIDSTLPGPFECHTDVDVVSPRGVVLMERGTQVMGDYKSDVHQGQHRLLSMVGYALTPRGITVPLDGNIGADGLGRAGFEGTVDNHWVERFGAAVILMLVENAFELAQAELQKSGSQNFNISGGSVNTLADQALQNSINIPPTITKDQGTRIAFWVRYPISFRQVYTISVAP